MTGYSFDANIVIDALLRYEPARIELHRATADGERAWISRMVWIEVMSKGEGARLRQTEHFLSNFALDEIDQAVAVHAASLRRQRPRLKSADAVILASAQLNGRTLVTRNTKDFPVSMPGVRVPYTI